MSPADSDVDLRTLLDSIQEFIVAKDGQGRWLFVNRIVLEAYAMIGFDYVGITDVELIERFPTHAEAFRYNIDTDEQAWQNGAPTQIEKSFLGPDGRINTWEVVKTPHFDAQGGRRLLTIVSRNVTERKLAETALQESERRFRSLAYLDALTGIANRRSILDQIAHYRAGATGHLPCALFYLDLDRFKAINDEFGHEFGDLLLVAFVARVSAACGPGICSAGSAATNSSSSCARPPPMRPWPWPSACAVPCSDPGNCRASASRPPPPSASPIAPMAASMSMN